MPSPPSDRFGLAEAEAAPGATALRRPNRGALHVPLLAFALSEVLTFSLAPSLQLSVAFCWYAFVGLTAVRDYTRAVTYFVGFTLLSLGAWTFVTGDAQPYNFWGLRLGGLSVNALVSLGLACTTALSLPETNCEEPPNTLHAFQRYYLAWALLAGIASLMLGRVHLDSFAVDALTSLFYVPYYILVRRIPPIDRAALLNSGVTATILASGAALVFGRRFEYGSNQVFIVMNAFSFVALAMAAIGLVGKSKPARVAFSASSIAILASGQVFIGGKTIIVLVIAVAWRILSSRAWFAAACAASVATLVLSWAPSLNMFELAPTVLRYKISQLFDVFLFADLEVLARLPTSVGNLAAELRTLAYLPTTDPWTFWLGRGFGGGMKDFAGLLFRFVGDGLGYTFDSLERDDFWRMHLPTFEVQLRGGVLFALAHLSLGLKFLLRKDRFAVPLVLLVLLAMNHSKEMLLLTTLFAMAPPTVPESKEPEAHAGRG